MPTAFISAFVMSLLLVGLYTHLARKYGLLDVPGDRQSHKQPTPTGAGIAMILALTVTSFAQAPGMVPELWLLWCLPAAFVLSVVGWLDDRRPLGTMFRLSVQLAVSLVLILSVAAKHPETGILYLLAAVLVMVGIMNAYNFMDGSNGMAAAQALFAGLILAWLFGPDEGRSLQVVALLLVGVCAGFLPFNAPGARVFMGDSGSVPLGMCLSVLMLLGMVNGLLSLPEASMVLALFLTDSTLTLLRRVIAGEEWYNAHKQHIYQRLIVQGWSHSRVLLTYQAVNVALVAPALILARIYPELAWILAGMMYLLLSTGWYTASLRLGVRD